MADKTYNGWTNYETWAVALWVDNEEYSYREAQEMARDHKGDEYGLSQSIEAWVKDEQMFGVLQVQEGDLSSSLASDLLGAALSEVNWYEIAEHWLADLDDDDDEEEPVNISE